MALKDILVLLLVVSPTSAYYSFMQKIPNGENVPHPCKANYMWKGVGHINPDGGGERNPFGRDFNNAGRMWTPELCRFDSDGDQKTNGEELGDPDCEWTEGSVPKMVTGITHPGICTPFGEGICAGRNTDVDCSIETFGESCDVIRNPDVRTIDLRFKEHEIPNTETNYYCQYFDLPSSQDLHIVANEGLIDNHNVLHHMLLFGCPDSYESSPTDDTPNPCSMNDGGQSCSTIISAWTVGLPGNCFGDDIGFRIGFNGFKKVKLEIHYNNPMLVSGYRDMTGMRLYYQQSKPGVQDLATFTVGQSYLEIPPGKESVEFQGTCSADCTRTIMTKPIYVVFTLNHMHYMGRSQKTEVWRNGQLIKVLADDSPYDYDSPVQYRQEPPFQILPGDEIVTTCVYSSMSKQRTVFFGEGTSDEMCFAFMTVYPADALGKEKWCVSQGPLTRCEAESQTPKYGCDWGRFVDLSKQEMTNHYTNLSKSCNLDGRCRQECKEYIEKNLENHPCLQNDMKTVVSSIMQTYKEGAQFLGWLHSCVGHHGHEMDCKKDCAGYCHDDGDGYGPVAGAPSIPVPHMVAILMMVLVAIATTIVY